MILEGITEVAQLIQGLVLAGGALLALAGALATADKAVEIVKKWRAPSADTARKLDTDKRRLDAHEESIADLRESNRVLCAGVLALIEHELHNGNADQMASARDDIIGYLQSKIAK